VTLICSQVLIAQREFEEAVDLVSKGTDFCDTHSESPFVREAKLRSSPKFCVFF